MNTNSLLLAALLVGAPAPEFSGANGWVNSPPLTREDLRGKVVLVDFWTYTCINWIRTAPYLRAWAEKYGDKGLVIVGVHSPEFAFEKDADNVRRAIEAMQVTWPVAIDSSHAIWRAFRNQYWPALYVVDSQGRIRHRQFGEGDYDQAEKIIQSLLAEAGHDVGANPTRVDARGAEVAADWSRLKSPENYLGSARTENFSRGTLKLNHWSLAGDWSIGKEAVVLKKANGRIAYRFHARDLHLVMGPPTRGAPVRFRVLIDGQPPGAAHGVDVDENGNGTATEQRMYQLIRQPQPIIDREFEIEFLDPGIEAYAFTFG